MKFGPGLIVTAAFIGPGTVYTASKSGAGFGFSMLWVVVFSVIATIIFQGMAAKLGIVSKAGLGEALQRSFENPVLKWGAIILVIGAILFGNAAFESGNISGAVAGAAGLLDDRLGASSAADLVRNWAPAAVTVLISVLALTLLMIGRYQLIQKILVPLVVLMSLFFVFGAMASRPDWGQLARGLIPTIAWDSSWQIDTDFFWIFVALIGTTVVPYNLFLHSSAAAFQWQDEKDTDKAIKQSRIDSTLAIALGGFVTAAILVTASQSFFGQERELQVSEISQQIRPVIGDWAQLFFCAGLLAAGLTSAITAPLAAALATSGCLGRTSDPADPVNRGIMMAVVLFGMIVALVGSSPAQVIFVAQVANGLILPVIAVFLLIAMNRKSILGKHTNTIVANILGGTVVLFVTALASIKLWKLMIGFIQSFGS